MTRPPPLELERLLALGRERGGLSADRIARMAGVSPTTLTRARRDGGRLSLDTLEAAAAALGTEAWVLQAPEPVFAALSELSPETMRKWLAVAPGLEALERQAAADREAAAETGGGDAPPDTGGGAEAPREERHDATQDSGGATA